VSGEELGRLSLPLDEFDDEFAGAFGSLC